MRKRLLTDANLKIEQRVKTQIRRYKINLEEF